MCMVLLLSGSVKDDMRSLDCDCLAQNYHTMEGSFTADQQSCVRTKDAQDELIGKRNATVNP